MESSTSYFKRPVPSATNELANEVAGNEESEIVDDTKSFQLDCEMETDPLKDCDISCSSSVETKQPVQDCSTVINNVEESGNSESLNQQTILNFLRTCFKISEQTYKCEQPSCETLSFDSLLDFSDHLHKHAEETSSCIICNRTFSEFQNVQMHLLAHLYKKYLTCDNCDQLFDTILDLQNHSKEECCFKCKICCDVVFHKNLKYHVAEHYNSCGLTPNRYRGDDGFRNSASLSKTMSSVGGRPEGYMCAICLNTFSRLTLFKEHLLEHAESSTEEHQCNFCCENFLTLTTFKIHIEIHLHEKYRICSDCDQVFDSIQELKNHRVNLSSTCRIDNGPLYKCDFCNTSFKWSFTLESHKRRHHNKKFTCAKCNEYFDNAESLKSHEGSHNNKSKSHTCHTCEKSFKSLRNLGRHKQSKTHIKKIFTCACNRGFSSEQLLQAHKDSDCKLLVSVLSTKDYCAEHLDRPTCKLCNLSFTDSLSLERHKSCHTDKIFTCGTCQGFFYCEQSLRAHENSHAISANVNSTPSSCSKDKFEREYPYKCEICNFYYKKTFSLEKHKKRNMCITAFTCTKCNKYFNSEQDLKTHENLCCDVQSQSLHGTDNTNSGDSLHKCDICNISFKWLFTLTSHIKTHHNEMFTRCAKCFECFDNEQSLKAHRDCNVNVHSKFVDDECDFPHKCKLCKMSFKWKSLLERHSIETHKSTQ